VIGVWAEVLVPINQKQFMLDMNGEIQ